MHPDPATPALTSAPHEGGARGIVVRHLGVRDYADTFAAMREFTLSRTEHTPDEIWLLEHPPVFTLGQASKPEHLLMPGDIPVVQSDRGGQVTYHGPGQLVAYILVDLHRLGYGVRSLVDRIESAIVKTLAGYGISAHSRRDAPGVYVGERKIGSLGLRIRHGRSYHGLSLNVKMDLEPFARINPCGYAGLQMTQVADLGGPAELDTVARDLTAALQTHLAGKSTASPLTA